MGRRSIELGCGVGLPSVAALAGGAGVTATDHYAAALDFTRYNARSNLGVEPETQLLDWHAPGAGVSGGFDLVLAHTVSSFELELLGDEHGSTGIGRVHEARRIVSYHSTIRPHFSA